MIYLIQGFFFYQPSSLVEDSPPEELFSAKIFTQKGLCRCMFAGTIFPDPNSEGILLGEMEDYFGLSTLVVTLSETKLSFTKKYDARPEVLKYSFRRQGNLWVGNYERDEGMNTKGEAWCILTPVPEKLFISE